MKWEDVSDRARDVMQDIGNFGPTVNAKDRQVKGWIDGDKAYYTSDDLRQIAAACTEVAAWLDARAAAALAEQKEPT